MLTLIDASRPTIRHMRIAVSYYCNLHCQHCYVPELNRTKYRQLLKDVELSLPQIDTFMDQLIADFGLRRISVTGGEALLRNVWPRTRHVMQYALARGIEVQLNTSGSGQIPVDEVARAADEVDGRSLLELHVSLDGIDDEKVDVFRGQQGAMRRAREAIQVAVQEQVHTQVRYTMTAENWQDTVPCYELVTDAGVAEFIMKPMFAAGTARDNTDLLIEGTDLVRQVQAKLLELSVGNATQLTLPQPVYLEQDDFPEGAHHRIINCMCGQQSAYLSTNGDLYPCTYMVGAPDSKQWVIGNIKDPAFDLAEVWARPSTYQEFRSTPKEANCTAQNIMSRSLTTADPEALAADLVEARAQCGG